MAININQTATIVIFWKVDFFFFCIEPIPYFKITTYQFNQSGDEIQIIFAEIW